MSFQQPATPAMEAIIDLHHNIMLVMIFIVVFISYILLRAIWLFNSNKRNFSEIPKLSKTRHFLSLEII
jgi:heme/copper-type cytochrome/quinol oxidase subunit 2